MPFPASPLIDPTNRLLGWSTSDFSMYGGQPATTIGAPGTAARQSDALSVPAPRTPALDAGASTAPPSDTAPVAAIADTPAEQAPAFSYSSYPAIAVSSPIPGHGGPAPATFAEAVPAVGSGSASPVVPITGGSLDGSAVAAPLTAAVLSAPELAMGDATAAAMLSSQAVPDLTAPVLALSESVVEGLAGTTANVAATIDQLAQLDGTLGNATEFAAGGQLIEAVDGAIAPLVETVAAVTGEALANVTDLAPGGATVTAADGFGGTDPVGGVSTLMTMVDSADAFDLIPAGTDSPALTSSGSILDSLMGEHAPDALLGDAAHHPDSSSADHHDDEALGIL